jgi:hypothetical protein
MKPLEMQSTESVHEKEASGNFQKVCDGRRQPRRGLWVRTNRYCARIAVILLPFIPFAAMHLTANIVSLPVAIPGGAHVPLAQLASINYSNGPPEVRSENGQLATYVSVVPSPVILGYVKRAGNRLRPMVHAPPGVCWK